jgi:hypothetical protein
MSGHTARSSSNTAACSRKESPHSRIDRRRSTQDDSAALHLVEMEVPFTDEVVVRSIGSATVHNQV